MKPDTSPAPKHTHYVSLGNNCIYPALTSPSGYEDEHPTEYRPATASEVQRYIEGAAEAVERPLDLMSFNSPVEATSTPTSIKLEDGPPTFTPPPIPVGAATVQPVPVAPSAPPPQPASPPVPAPLSDPPPPPPPPPPHVE